MSSAEDRVGFHEEPLEVDCVVEGIWGTWAIEVKTGRMVSSDLRGLGEFVGRHPKFRPLVVCDDQARPVAGRAGFDSVSWSERLPSPRTAAGDGLPLVTSLDLGGAIVR